MVRCFIGIFAPENIKEKVVTLQNELKHLINSKMVEKENLHICFSFLGEIEEREIEKIANTMDGIAKNYEKFDVKISGIKLIPSEKYIRVIALGVIDEDKIKNLNKEIKQKIGGDTKPPHLTLCRVKSIPEKKAFLEKIKKIELDFGTMTIDSLCLVKSKLSKSGPIYSIIHRSALR